MSMKTTMKRCMEKDKRKEIITCGMVRLVIVLLLMFLVCSCSNETTIPDPFKVGNASFDSLSDAVSFLKSNPEEDSNVIMLTRDTSDLGAEIKGIPGSVKIDLQAFTYTVSNEGTGIVIDNQDGSVSITGGIIQAENGKKGMERGNTDKALITVKSNLELTDTVVNVDVDVDAIEISSGVLSLNGRTDIQTLAGRNFISARGSSKVNVCSEDVVMTGRMALSDSAEVDLGHATLNFTNGIAIEGADVIVHMDECTIVVAKLVILEQPSVLNVAPFNESLVLTVKTEVDPSDDNLVFQWYDETDNPIVGATSSELICGPYDEKCIHSFYCKVKRVVTIGGQEIASDECWTDVANVAYTGLPTVYINTPDGVPVTSKEDWLAGATIKIEGALNEDWNIDEIQTSIKGRGNSTWSQPKKPFALKLDDKQKVLGMPKSKRWVLIANYLDNSFMRNSIAFYISDKVKADYTVRGEFVDLVLNGTYQGLYWLGEAIKVDEKRVNIDEDNDYLIELDVYYDEKWKFKSSIRNLPYMVKNDDSMKPTEVGNVRLAALQTAIDEIESLLYSGGIGSSAPPNPDYETRIDIDSWAKFWIINEIMDNGELNHPKSCYFAYTVSNGVLKAGPVWDFDWASLYQRDYCIVKNSLYYDALFKSDAFNNRVKELWNEYSNQIEIGDEIERIRSQINIAQQFDAIRWGVHKDPSGIIREDFDAYVDFLKETLAIKKAVVAQSISQL